MNWEFIIGFAIFIELISCILRFEFDLHSKSIQKKFKFPVRIHHMYLGILIALIGIFLPPSVSAYSSAIFPVIVPTITELGIAIALSDVAHHFVVLPAFHKKIDFP